MKKLVFFIGGLNFGGMERVVFIANELLKNDYDVTIATLYQNNADYDVKAKMYDLNIPPKDGKINKLVCMLRRINRTKKMKKEIKPDIVFSFGMYSNYLNALTKKKEKIVMGIRSYDWLTEPFVSRKLDKYIVSRFDKINSVSKQIAHDAEVYWNIDIEKNSVIYNPYDLNYIEEKADEEIDDFVYESDCFYFITMGRLCRQKGYIHLIHAFKTVSEKKKNARLIIMGSGEKREELLREINLLGLASKVFLIGGKKNPYQYVKRANVYVMSSLTEGFPNALVEAMCIGTPVVSVNCKSGPGEILFDVPTFENDITTVVADYGVITKGFSEKGEREAEKYLAEGMIFSHENYHVMQELAQKAKKRVKQFSYDRFKQNIVKELDNFEY